MVEKLSATKFVSGFNLTGFAKSLSIGIKLAIIIGIGYAIYITAIKPHYNPVPTQKAETIVNNTYNPEKKSLIDFKVWVFRVKVW